MSYVDQIDAEADRLEREYEAEDARKELRADAYREAWDRTLQERSIDAETGFKYMPKMIDVLSEATALTDDRIFKSMMQALIHCAQKGQIEAVEAMNKVRDFFVEERLDHDK